ncbi:MAG: hypothetical protein BWY70_00722 [Bacteroidetes bacterium ADurb.Bin408]|nr:MAG: hypothetical protein BWY70_00722 [Bacteroidetes bacterium ADurb.Bin408]
MLNKLFEISEKAIEESGTDFIRPQIAYLQQNERLIGIKGSKGVGKTTLLLQYAKIHLKKNKKLYLSLDNPFFAGHNLLDYVDDYVKNGGDYLLLDEVHHYPDWSLSLKMIYDTFKNLKVIYTGSSLLHLTKGRADLSRRGMIYTLQGLSLREFINLTEKTDFAVLSLDDILKNHSTLSKAVISKVKPILKYNEYIQWGYYPFFLENKENYLFKLMETINQILEAELPLVAKINYANVNKLKQLLQLISESVPFKPNLEKISGQTSISKNTLKDYLFYLQEAMLILMLRSYKKTQSTLAKPEKIYMHNPNIMFGLAHENSNVGNLRECFFLNQLYLHNKVNYSESGDFLVNGKYTFEIGGKNKTYKQIAGIKNSYIAADDIEIGLNNTIPLWLFGFLY